MLRAKPEWEKTIPTKCQYCGQNVFYYENSFGSKVFFDELGKPWPIHECGHNSKYQKEIDESILDDLNTTFDEFIQEKAELELDFDLANEFNFDAIEYSENNQIKQKTEHELKHLNDKTKFRKKQGYRRENKEIRKVFPQFKETYEVGFIRKIEKHVDILRKEGCESTEINFSTLPKKWVKNKLVKINVVTHDIFDQFYHSYTGYALQKDLDRMKEGQLVSFKVKGCDIAFGNMVWNFQEIKLV
jgi:hypothetical protein